MGRVVALLAATALSALALATPAQATGSKYGKVKLSADADCGKVTLKLSNTTKWFYGAKYTASDGQTGWLYSNNFPEGHQHHGNPEYPNEPQQVTLTFPEDSGDGKVTVQLGGEWGVDMVGTEKDLAPKPLQVKVYTNCERPAKPTVSHTGPTCEDEGMTVTVTNPNKLSRDIFKVRIGDAEPVVLAAGASTSQTVTASVDVLVKWGYRWKLLQRVEYTPITDCPTPGPTPTATAEPGPTPTATAPPAGGGGGLPVTGTSLPVLLGLGALVTAAGAAVFLVARRRRLRFTA